MHNEEYYAIHIANPICRAAYKAWQQSLTTISFEDWKECQKKLGKYWGS